MFLLKLKTTVFRNLVLSLSNTASAKLGHVCSALQRKAKDAVSVSIIVRFVVSRAHWLKAQFS